MHTTQFSQVLRTVRFKAIASLTRIMTEKKPDYLGEYRIHGDNIVECERTLDLISEAFELEISYDRGPMYAPIYNLDKDGTNVASVQLFPGYDRWGVNIQKILKQNGAPLREAADAILTRLTSKNKEEIIFSIEFCNALPAGNNAWQRTGRALATASAGIPYLYYADLGGVELDEERGTKAHRYPNPLVPFSYITLGLNYGALSIPVYAPSPSSPEDVRLQFRETFGLREGKELVKCLISGVSTDAVKKTLTERTLILVELLASLRRQDDTFKGSDWRKFLGLKKTEEKIKWLESKGMRWSKKNASKVRTTNTFQKLISLVTGAGSISVGASDIPICLIPATKRGNLAKRISELYGSSKRDKFYEWFTSKKSALLIVWITGFKPHGDDSRPDRGLVPLARMLFGQDIDVLSIVYGPAPSSTWSKLKASPAELAEDNGLWESIINLSDGLLVDSATLPQRPLTMLLSSKRIPASRNHSFSMASAVTKFSEQDVDSVIHFLFSKSNLTDIFECMCNPPGGDWSGLSFLDFKTKIQYRWTSLPRVSKSNGKRPDHVIEIKLGDGRVAALSIESKEKAVAFEDGMGLRLDRYISDLIKMPPNVYRKDSADWVFDVNPIQLKEKIVYLSGAAYCWRDATELKKVFKRGKFDFVFAFEFFEKEERIVLHVKASDSTKSILEKILAKMNKTDALEIQVH
ncbi:Uncharacterised protein [Candidatus Gugararchaeum adminiculabundum]|nr:Uncharacterised protein [Candidatus Gugararchaeum adminiculabundum]